MSGPLIAVLSLSGNATRADQNVASLLFHEDKFVVEPLTPVDFANHVMKTLEVPASDSTKCEGKSFLFYSGWCPHCHAFAPRWSELAQVVQRCDSHAGMVSAFECTSHDTHRYSDEEGWKALGWEAGEKMPEAICDPFISQTYPTVGIFVKKNCELSSPAELITLDDYNSTWFKNDELSYYRIPMGGIGKTLGSAFDALTEAGAFPGCRDKLKLSGSMNEIQRQELKEIVDGLPHTEVKDTSSRWINEAQVINPSLRIHDAILGVYFIMRDWVTDQQSWEGGKLETVKNFIKLLSILPGHDEHKKVASISAALEPLTILEESHWRNLTEGFTLYGIPDVSADGGLLRHENSFTCPSSTCLVWTLIHVLVQRVQDVLENNPAYATVALAADNTLPEFSELLGEHRVPHPATIVTVIHGLVVNFFLCDTCRTHFNGAYMSGYADLYQWTHSGVPELAQVNKSASEDYLAAQGAKLWWWRFHNVVDVRVSLDNAVSALRQELALNHTSEDIALPYDGEDVRFPTRKMCPACYIKAPHDSLKINKDFVESFLYVEEDESKMAYDRYHEFNLTLVDQSMKEIYSFGNLADDADISWEVTSHTFSSQPSSVNVR